MIDVKRLRFDGKWNYQEGLSFYFSEHGRAISFLIKKIRNRKGWTQVTMQPDVNHERPHVHIDKHGASFAIDTGELLAGDCDGKTRTMVQEWINRHRKVLKELWDIAKSGRDYQPYVEKIRDDVDFEEMNFKDDKPECKTIIGHVVIWHNGEII